MKKLITFLFAIMCINISNAQDLTVINRSKPVDVEFPMNIQTVENIKELKQIKSIMHPLIFILGYYEKGDGGGGWYYWDTKCSESDNGGTIIKLSNFKSGRYRLIPQEQYLVEQFGCRIGIDNTKKLQSMADAGITKIIFNYGVYPINGTVRVPEYVTLVFNNISSIAGKGRLILDNVQISSKIHQLFGDELKVLGSVINPTIHSAWFGLLNPKGDQTFNMSKIYALSNKGHKKIEFDYTPDTINFKAGYFNYVDADGLHLDFNHIKFRINGNLNASKKDAFRFKRCKNVLIENIHYCGADTTLYTDVVLFARADSSDYLTIRNSRFIGYSRYILHTEYSDFVNFSGNYVRGNTSHPSGNSNKYRVYSAVNTYGKSITYGHIVENNYLENVHIPILLTIVKNSNVTNNIVKNSFDSSIYLKGADNTITKNKVYNAGKDGIKNNDSGSWPDQNHNTIITDNIVKYSGLLNTGGGTCILSVGNHAIISNNILWSKHYAGWSAIKSRGIAIQGGYTTITGNTIYLENDGVSSQMDENTAFSIGSPSKNYITRNIAISNNNVSGAGRFLGWSAYRYNDLKGCMVSGNNVRLRNGRLCYISSALSTSDSVGTLVFANNYISVDSVFATMTEWGVLSKVNVTLNGNTFINNEKGAPITNVFKNVKGRTTNITNNAVSGIKGKLLTNSSSK